jgi:hypothetical protein
MPRKSRIDAPGALHHIIFRGLERRKIFRDNKDRDGFPGRLENRLPETHMICYARGGGVFQRTGAVHPLKKTQPFGLQ